MTQIPDLKVSYAFYRNLQSSSQVDIYSFDAQTGDTLYAGISIPAVRGLEDYGVSLAVVGPGFPPIKRDGLPAEPLQDLGGILFPSEIGEDFFEPFTQTNYWRRQRVTLNLLETGTYYMMIWNPNGIPGKYVLDTGREEVFRITDFFLFPIWWFKVHAFFGHTPQIVTTIAGILLLSGIIFLRGARRKRKDGDQQPTIPNAFSS